MAQYTLVVSQKSKPRLSIPKMLLAEKHLREAQDPSYVLIAKQDVITDPNKDAFVIVYEGSMAATPDENELGFYQALVIAHLCIQHQEWQSEIYVDGRAEKMLERALYLDIQQFIAHLVPKYDDKLVNKTTTDAVKATARLINCDCLMDRIVAFEQATEMLRPLMDSFKAAQPKDPLPN